MRSTRARRGMIRLSIAAVVAGTVISMAATANADPVFGFRDSAGAIPVPAGTGNALPVGYVRDAQRTTHAALLLGAHLTRLQYLTRAHGSSQWTSHRVLGSAMRDISAARLVLSFDRRHEFLVMVVGHELYVAMKRTTASNFPAITAANRTATVVAGGLPGESGSLPLAVGLPHGRLAVLWLGSSSAPDKTRTLSVLVVRPGDLVEATNLPASAWSGDAGLARDPTSGDLIAVGNTGAGNAVDIAAWVRRPGQATSWSNPQPIGRTEFDGVRQRVSSVTSTDGKMWMGLWRSRDSGSDVASEVPLGVYVAHSTLPNLSGPWVHPRRVPNTGRRSSDLLLAAEPGSNRLQALYRSQGTNHGLMHQTRSPKGIWSPPNTVTHHHSDSPLALILTNGRGYRYMYVRQG
jgi:hypothetical protein